MKRKTVSSFLSNVVVHRRQGGAAVGSSGGVSEPVAVVKHLSTIANEELKAAAERARHWAGTRDHLEELV